MSTLFFLSHICSVNTFSSANYMPNHVLDSGDVDFLAVHTPLLSLIVFFFFSSQTWKQITAERCNSCIPAGVYRMFFVQGGKKRNRVESWEFPYPTHL